jgi:hypothetical protein
MADNAAKHLLTLLTHAKAFRYLFSGWNRRRDFN